MNEQTIGLSELIYNYGSKLANLESCLNALEKSIKQITSEGFDDNGAVLSTEEVLFDLKRTVTHNNNQFENNLSRFNRLLNILDSSINGSSISSSTNGTLKSR